MEILFYILFSIGCGFQLTQDIFKPKTWYYTIYWVIILSIFWPLIFGNLALRALNNANIYFENKTK